MLADIIFFLGVIFGKFIFWIFKKIFSNKNKTKGLFKLNAEPTENSEEDVQIQEKLNKFVQSPYAKNEQESPKENARKYSLKESQITEAEKCFFEILKEVVGNNYRIEPQVQLSSIVRPIDSNNRYTNYTDFNRIKAKSIDFVLFDDKNKPWLAIELDDRSHFKWERMRRDQFVNDLMTEVGLRIIHVPFSYSYDSEKLRKQIFV
ncbi:MAG: DUF2726 domain-containing protein [Candidatus Paceibacterota bacterium]